jgi:hypothetical protein
MAVENQLGWFKLSDKYYTRDIIYKEGFGQDVDMKKLEAFPANFGGPVGVSSFFFLPPWWLSRLFTVLNKSSIFQHFLRHWARRF